MRIREHLEIVEDEARQIEKVKKAHSKNVWASTDAFISKRNKLIGDLKKDVYNFGRILAYYSTYEEFDRYRTKLSRHLMNKGEGALETIVSDVLTELLIKKGKDEIKPDFHVPGIHGGR